MSRAPCARFAACARAERPSCLPASRRGVGRSPSTAVAQLDHAPAPAPRGSPRARCESASSRMMISASSAGLGLVACEQVPECVSSFSPTGRLDSCDRAGGVAGASWSSLSAHVGGLGDLLVGGRALLFHGQLAFHGVRHLALSMSHVHRYAESCGPGSRGRAGSPGGSRRSRRWRTQKSCCQLNFSSAAAESVPGCPPGSGRSSDSSWPWYFFASEHEPQVRVHHLLLSLENRRARMRLASFSTSSSALRSGRK